MYAIKNLFQTWAKVTLVSANKHKLLKIDHKLGLRSQLKVDCQEREHKWIASKRNTYRIDVVYAS